MATVHHLGLRDADIAFRDEGDGEPVLLVHASFGAAWFDRVAPLLNGYRVVLTHRAGYGGSRDKSGGLSLADHARHLAEVLKARKIERAHVVGHSSGGSIALELASAYPRLVRSLTLMEPAFPYAPDEPRSDAMRDAIRAAKEGDLPRAFGFFPGSVCGPGYRDVFRRALGPEGLEESIRSGRYFFEHEIGALAGWDSDAAGLGDLGQPALLVDGAEGERLNSPYRARNRALAKRLAHAEQISLPGVSHAMPLEDPALVARTVIAFIRRHPLVD
ncbi:alpha/beta fold hydrolase [Streptomyces sp. NPDC002018]|uniref:alpha/beta fold hydrolase n=1 Tax=Streptomyces sp. NPDC002018 TaxID=3364629 RepID=UPI00367F9E0B